MSVGGFVYDPEPDPRDEELRRRREQAGGLWTGPAQNPKGPETVAAKVELLLSQARQKIVKNDYRTAIARLDAALKLDRRNAEAYLLQAECALALDQPQRALRLLDVAGRYAPDGLITRIEEARRRCARVAADEYLERARELLRGGDARRAIAALRRCEELWGADEELKVIRAYAEVRLDQETLSADRTDARWLDSAELERVLRWLTREELAEAELALSAQRFDAALRACQAAQRIDRSGAYCSLLCASVLFMRLQQAAAGKVPPDLKTIKAQLVKALSLVRFAERDPSLSDRRKPLAAAIDATLRSVDEHLAQAKDLEPVDDLINRYNALMRHYYKPVLNGFEASNLRSSLAPIDAEVNLLRRQHPADSPAGQALNQLARAIADILAQLR
jgi:tetratricopeptide (TPR) repeat protein